MLPSPPLRHVKLENSRPRRLTRLAQQRLAFRLAQLVEINGQIRPGYQAGPQLRRQMCLGVRYRLSCRVYSGLPAPHRHSASQRKINASAFGMAADSPVRHAKGTFAAHLRASLIAGPDLAIDSTSARDGKQSMLEPRHLRGRLFQLDVAERRADGNMLARVAGQLHTIWTLRPGWLAAFPGHTKINNVLIQPQYVSMRIELVNALRPS